jgi:hypothetical protein
MNWTDAQRAAMTAKFNAFAKDVNAFIASPP